ncbi:MAG: MBL fold metallo-hydrolase, partial [Planctomycetota bacterium]
YLPKNKVLLAGDTLEDTVTYVDEPHRLEAHLNELDRLSSWNISTIFPSHGNLHRIENGGYNFSFINATRDYVAKLLRCPYEPNLCSQTLSEFVATDLENGSLIYFDAYDRVHRHNVNMVLENARS